MIKLKNCITNISFDEELDYEVDEEALDTEKFISDFFNYTEKKLNQNDLFNMKILKREHDRTHPTIGGLLLAGKTPYLEYARIKCARFRGNTMDEFIDQKEFIGPLYRQVEDAMKFAELYIAKAGKVVRLQRIDRYEVPLEVIREAIVNAVVHRDYSISGADIKFAIFQDRIEITSPGALPRSLEIEDIIAGRSEIRNKVIARFFREINFIEQWGTGIRKIIRLLEEHGLQSPQFIESGLFFKIIISKNKKENNRDHKKTSQKTTSFTTSITTPITTPKVSDRIIACFKANPEKSIAELAEALHLTKDGVKYHIKNLKERGLLKRIGSSRNGYWLVD